MFQHYDENTVIKFNDLRNLIQEEFAKIHEGLKNKPQKDKPLNIQQLADHYGVSKATIHNWMKRGSIVGFKVGKGRFFYISEVEKSLAEHKFLDVLQKRNLIDN